MPPLPRLLPVLLLLGALSIGACTSDEERFEQHLARAEAYLETGEPQAALIELRSALKLRPTDAETNYRIGRVLVDRTQYLDALFFFSEAHRLDPTHVGTALAAAKLLLHDDTATAQQFIEEARARDPENPVVHERRTELALVQGDIDTALAAAHTMVELDPTGGQGYMQLGIVHMARIRESRLGGEVPGDEIFKAALDAFAKADELFGGSFFARIERGRVLASWPGHGDRAASEFRSAVELPGLTPEQVVRAARGSLSWALTVNDSELRRWSLEKIVGADESQAWAWQELALLADEEGGSGEEEFRTLLARRADDVDTHVRFARYLLDRDRTDEALAHLDQTARSGVGGATALAELMLMQLSLGRSAEAEQTLTRLGAEFPDDSLTEFSRARLALNQERVADAADVLRRLSGSVDTPEAHRLLAIAEFRLENLEAATAAIDRALALFGEPAPDSMLRRKAQIHDAARDWSASIRALRRLVRMGAELGPREQRMLARALYETNQTEAARRVLGRLLAQESPPPLAVLEYVRREGGEYPERAYQLLLAAHARAPRQVAVLRALTAADFRAGRGQLALDRLNRAADGDAATPASLLLRAEVLARMKRLGLAQRDALAAFEANPSLPGAIDLLMAIYAARGKLDEARLSLEEADSAGTLEAEGRVMLARLRLQGGDLEGARRMFERALAETSELPGAKNDLAFILARQGADLDRALALAREAQQEAGSSAAVADTLGYVYQRKGLFQAALDQFRFAIDLAEEEQQPRPEYPFHLGLALRALGRNEEAVRAFEAALALGEDFSELEELQRELKAARSARSPG